MSHFTPLFLVETLVGKGVFKLSCQKEELILYSNDGSQSSEEWVNAISQAIVRHRSNSASLRKESSRRDPVKRPDIMKMRRESLGQILLLRKGILTPAKHKMVLRERRDLSCSPGNSPIVFSPRSKKRPAPIPMDMPGEENCDSKSGGDNTPSKKSIRLDAAATNDGHFTPKEKMPPPPMANVQLRAKINKKINRSTSAWKTLSLNRKDKVKNDNSQIFRSPSIYENSGDNNQEGQENNHQGNSTNVNPSDDQNTVMNRYLSGKFCPLTPSQQPTNVSHLVEANEKGPEGSENGTSTALVPATPTLAMTNYCSIM